MKTRMILLMCLMFCLCGCPELRQTAIELSLEEVENAKVMREIAYNFLKAWPECSGFLRVLLRMDELDVRTVAAMDELDELALRIDELSGHELGRALALKILIKRDIVLEILETYSPELIEFVPLMF